MPFRIKISDQNQDIIRKLTNLFNFSHEGIISNISISVSLQSNYHFDLEHAENTNTTGQYVRAEIFFGKMSGISNYIIYKALFDQHYRRNLSEKEFAKLVKLHLQHGLKILSDNIIDKEIGITTSHYDFLISIIKKGTELIDDTKSRAITPIKDITAYPQPISFDLGETEEKESLTIRLNDLKEFDSHHIAIAGMTGSGKTEIVKDILYQIYQQTNGQLNFIFFDYKGEGKSEKIFPFLKATDCKNIDVLQDGFKVNPLSYICLKNERVRRYNIKSFIDAIASIETKLGTVQKHTLQTVLSNCFDKGEENIHPTLQEVFRELQDYYEENNIKIDTLYTIIDDLSRDIFRTSNEEKKVYEKNLYLSLPKTLSDTLRQLFVFITLNYLLSIFNTCDDVVPNSDRINPLRYIIVIDEAHVYLKNKNARKILEELLRVIRSKGVVVIMISQGPSDYKRSDFDFASQVKLPICLNIKDKDYKLIKSFIGTPKSEHHLRQLIESLDNGRGIINIKEPQLISIKQFWKRSV